MLLFDFDKPSFSVTIKRMNIPRNIGFWSVLAIVMSSQIGSGVFMLPAILAPYGYYSLAGWLISSSGAVFLAIMFALLCSRFPKTGGPHAYVQSAFGSHIAFFIGWAYWVVSWVSTVAVIVTCVGYLSPFIGDRSPMIYLVIEISLLCIITMLNIKGVYAAGKVGFFLNLIRFIPLFVLPLIALHYFKSSNFAVSNEISSLSTTQILGQVAILAIWGFIGLETGTTPAGSVENPSKTIPRAVIFGTICVALLYALNSIGIMGLIPANELVNSKAPYADATQYIFGGNWHLLISIIASMVLIGTINAWTLASGQIILGLAEDNLMPKFFAKKNSRHAPFWGILVSSAGIVILLILTSDKSLAKQISAIIDYSVAVFLFVYLVCGFAAIKISMNKNSNTKIFQWLAIYIAIAFCSWVIYETPLKHLAVSSLFVLSGLPVYFFWYLKKEPNFETLIK